MPDPQSAMPAENPSGAIGLDELMRGQLAGKLVALGRYDEILWKIRTGYVAVLYGMLAFLLGSESRLAEALAPAGALEALFPMSLGLSMCALLIDCSFLLAKLRVVAARDRLSDLAALRAREARPLTDDETRELLRLLHLSGEQPGLPPYPLLLGGLWPLPGIYLFTPVAVYALIP